ncbi:MAG: alpha/beta fold hydrolase [Verrucomicrobiae bacterium]|nr:alpha/beta fold hydrolase [Verrucomicrobiae bacterium]
MPDSITNARELFTAALEFDSEPDREAFLQEAAVEKPDLVAQVRELLKAHREVADEAFFSANPKWRNESSPSETDMEGSRIGDYRLLEKIGEGGMGVVYMAEQEAPVRRKVALKIIKLGMDTKQVVARFEAERQALAMMENPHIAKLLDAGVTQSGRPYFVMELVRGIAITKYCDDNRLSIRERLKLFLPVCQAIQHAHQKGVIHRDVKPTNILVTQIGGDAHPMVIDFGVAKATHQRLTDKTFFTRFTQMVGTPSYMSPEQAEMSIHDVDTRTDVYALGILLYELMTGTTPFPEERLRSASYAELQKIIKEEEPLRPSTWMSRPEVTRESVCSKRRAEPAALVNAFKGDLDWIVLKAIDKDRERRYATPNDLAADVTRHLNDETVEARPPTLLYQLQKAWRRHRVLYNAAAMVAASLLLGICVSLWMAWVATAAKRDAEDASARETALRKQTVEDARRQRLVSFGTDLRTAMTLLKENRLTEARTLLDRYQDDTELHGYYWGHLNRILRGGELETLGHKIAVRSLSFSRDGSRLASQTMSGRVRLYAIAKPKEDGQSRLLAEFGGGMLSYGAQDGCVALSPDGRLLASDQQGTLMVWDADTGERRLVEENVCAPLAFTPDSASLVANTGSGLRLWNTADWSSRPLGEGVLQTDASPFCLLRFTPDGRHLILSRSRFATSLDVLDMASGAVVGRLEGLDGPSTLFTDGKRVMAGGRGGRVQVWDLASQKLIASFQAQDNVVLGIALSPDGKFLVTSGSERAIFLWDAENFSRLGRLEGHHGQVWNLQSSNGNLLASASIDHSVKLWNWEVPDSGGDQGQEPETPAAEIFELADHVPVKHSLRIGADIQAAIDAAAPGDEILLAPGTHEVSKTVVLRKPLTIRGTGESPTILKGVGVPLVVSIETGSDHPTLLEGLEIDSEAQCVSHRSGTFTIKECRVTMRSVLEFQYAIGLKAKGERLDEVLIDHCQLMVVNAGNTAEGTPPDVDVILVDAGARYAKIAISDCDITNAVPNRIANGLETRSNVAQIVVQNNNIHCQGLGIVIPNHRGKVELLGNTIWSKSHGINLTSDSPEAKLITGNTITIEAEHLDVYPMVVQDFIADARSSACMTLGSASAGVTVGFFYQPYLGQAINILIEDNVLAGNPNIGIEIMDSTEPETFGPSAPNDSHDITIIRNDFSGLNSKRDVALGKSTYDNLVYQNVGLETVFREAGKSDRNRVAADGESTWRYVLDEIHSPALEGNLLGDPATRPLWVCLPSSYDTSPTKRYPVVYALHGFTGDHSSFKSVPVLRLNIGAQAAGLVESGEIQEMIFVLVDATSGFGGSMFASNAVTGDYLAYVARDIVNHIDSAYRTLTSREHRSIVGHSMGANGAFSLAMTYPKVFGALAALSPSANFAATPTFLDRFFLKNPDKLDEPTIVRTAQERQALLPPQSKGNVDVNLMYAWAVALSPNPDKPPYCVDLPVSYPDKTVVEGVWNRWLDQDLVSKLERDGDKLRETKIWIDTGVGPTTFMKEGHDVSHLRAALDKAGLDYTFVESPGDHLSHLRERTFEVLKFLGPSLSGSDRK